MKYIYKHGNQYWYQRAVPKQIIDILGKKTLKISLKTNKLITASKSNYQNKLNEAGYPAITTEVLVAPEFYYAEQYHQQYLAKNPRGYCGLAGTGVSCSVK